MTLPAQTRRNSYIANGTQTSFPYTFRIDSESDVTVLVDGVLAGTVSISNLGDEGGGNVTITPAPTAGVPVIIYGSTAIDQTYSYSGFNDFPAEAHEGNHDRSRMIDQELRGAIERCLRLSPSDTRSPSNFVIPQANPTEPAYLTIDTSGNLAWATEQLQNAQALTAELIEPYLPVSNVPSIMDYDAVNDGTTDIAAALNNAIGAGQTALTVPPGTFLLQTAGTYGVKLIFQGGVLRCDGVIATLGGGYEAGIVQCFDEVNSGEVRIGTPQEVRPEHWGTANTALRAAIKRSRAGSTIRLRGIDYTTVAITIENDPLDPLGDDSAKVIDGVTPAQRYNPAGAGFFYGTRIILADGQNASVFTIDSGSTNLWASGGICNVMLQGNKTNNPLGGSGVQIQGVKDYLLKNLYIWDFQQDGINFNGDNTQVSMEGFIECWNNSRDGIRGGAMGDIQCSANIRCVNNGRFGFYMAAGSGRFDQIYSYFNTSYGVYIEATVNKHLRVNYIRTEDNKLAGFRCRASNVSIGMLEAPDNGADAVLATTDRNKAGLHLDAEARNVIVEVLSAANRAAANHNQQYLLVDESAGGCVVQSIINDAFGAHGIANEQTIKYLTTNSFDACRVVSRMLLADTYANIKDAGSTITPLCGTYSRYRVEGLSEDVTINNTALDETSQGMTLEFEVSSAGAHSVTFAASYVDSTGAALTPVALAAGQALSVLFSRRGNLWVAMTPTVIA